MKYTKLIAVLLALLLIVSLFAACGGEKDDDTQPAPTLPTMDAPVATGGETAPEQGTKPVSADDPFAETKDWMPGGQTTETPQNASEVPVTGEAQPVPTQPAPSQPAPTEASADRPAPTEPRPSESTPVLDDSDEDLPVTTTEYPDDTDEDLP